MNATYSKLTFIALALLISDKTVLADQTKLPIIRVSTDGVTALATGLSIGQQSKSLFPDIEARYDSFLSSLISQEQFQRMHQKQLPVLFSRLSKKHQDELQGVEAAWELVSDSKLSDGKLSTDEYRLINFLPDLGFIPNGSGFAVMNKASSDKNPILGKNLDWKINPQFQTLQSITAYKNGEHTVVNIGFAGIISIFTGYNSQGLFLTGLNAEPYSPYTQRENSLHKKHNSLTFNFKKLLESKENAKQALKDLSTRRYSSDISIMVADKKSVQILEYSKEEKSKVRTWKSPLHTNTPWGKRQQIAAVNCLALRKMPNTCQGAKDLVRWQRFRHLANFDTRTPASLRDLSAIMTDTQNKRYEIFNQDTLQSVIYQPASGRLDLYANLTGDSVQKPVYQTYLDLTETLLKSKKKSVSYLNFKTLSWLFIISLSIGLWWFVKKRS